MLVLLTGEIFFKYASEMGSGGAMYVTSPGRSVHHFSNITVITATISEVLILVITDEKHL
jgi:hypothetical protein